MNYSNPEVLEATRRLEDLLGNLEKMASAFWTAEASRESVDEAVTPKYESSQWWTYAWTTFEGICQCCDAEREVSASSRVIERMEQYCNAANEVDRLIDGLREGTVDPSTIIYEPSAQELEAAGQLRLFEGWSVEEKVPPFVLQGTLDALLRPLLTETVREDSR